MDSNLNGNALATEEGQTRTVVLYGEVGDGPQTEVTIFDETMWMTQRQMAEVFGTTASNINVHLGNIYQSRELSKDSTIKEFLIVQLEHGRSVRRKFFFYNLDAIIAVGYRVNSTQATRFRIWATQILKEYIIKGFALDDKRLKQGKQTFGQDYFRELLQRVRSIRASEAQIWRQVTDIFIACSIDYDKGSKTTRYFFARVQNLFITPLPGKRRRKSSTPKRTTTSLIWVFPLGKQRQTVESISRTQSLQKTIFRKIRFLSLRGPLAPFLTT